MPVVVGAVLFSDLPKRSHENLYFSYSFVHLLWHSIGYYAKLSKRSSHLASVNNEESGEFPWNKVRLPQSVNPLEYGIFLHPNLTEKTFSGKVEIKCEVLKSTKFVVLHSKNLNISKARLTTLPSNDVNEAHIRMKNDTD